ncbi:MAG: hypothetical protein ACQEXX_01945 [Bacillota bacterium]
MKIYNYELEAFITFLRSLKLERKDSRMRTRFKNMLIEKYQRLIDEINEINATYSVKDSEGNTLIEEDRVIFSDNSKRLEDLRELTNEVVVFEQSEENKDMFLSIKESVLHRAPLEFEGDDADRFDRFCEIVEQINY